ncbi:MAG: TIGR00282 family metallophosphoesterase [Alphaproteobacteria bacterium TMED89]|nr:TIGR00282 family metallophosphoesterase [Rhodospirillaceae bacterium]RPH13079.1 MAG: TIGR00282 family metallophosphoesterase [Alphaproteobacteria bacterium TMED89]
MRTLIIGDVVGRTGRQAVAAHVPSLIERLKLDFVIVNGENATHGFGLSPEHAQGFFEAGVDCIILGNHSFDRKEIIPMLNEDDRILRPINYPDGTPGRGKTLLTGRNGHRVGVIQTIGRLFMNPDADNPFLAADAALDEWQDEARDATFVDVHAEATSEKIAFGHYLDGRVTAVEGTHTHAPTADVQILPGGTAFQSDLGMTGDYDSVIGMLKDASIPRFTQVGTRAKFGPAEGEATLCGLFVESNDEGLATRAEPVRVGGRLQGCVPDV